MGLCQAPTLLLGYGPSFIVLHSDNTDKDDRQTIQSNDWLQTDETVRQWVQCQQTPAAPSWSTALKPTHSALCNSIRTRSTNTATVVRVEGTACPLFFNVEFAWLPHDQKLCKSIIYQHWISNCCRLSATVCAACWKLFPVVCGCRQSTHSESLVLHHS